MDITAAWQEVARFKETSIATSAHLYGQDQENALVHEFLEKVPIATLFACLQDASDRRSSKEVKQACKCINRVLSSGTDGSSLFFQPDIVPFVLAGLSHVEKEAKELVMNQFIAHLGKKPTPHQYKVVADPLILERVCSGIGDEDIEVAAKASTVLETFSSIPESTIYQAVLDSLKKKVQSSEITENSIEYMRYLETIVKICAQDDTHMECGIALGAIDLILDCLNSTDPLFLMNVVDLIPAVCRTKIGVEYVSKSGTLKNLLEMTQDPFVGGNVIRLVGEISATAARSDIESWSWSDATLSEAFLETVERKMQSSDALDQIAAMDALAAFGSASDKELLLLHQHQRICQKWLHFSTSTKLPVKANCFHSIARVLGAQTRLTKQPDEVPKEDEEVWNMCERLFNGLVTECAQQSTMVLLMNTLKQPFEELRTSVFHVLRSVAAQNNSWGMRVLLSYGGFFEFLLDRTTEATKDTREWKFAVLDAVLASPFQSQLDESLQEKLKASLRQGPYAKAAALAEMALESV
uniref:26S proteasome non-ATPase regulatory subunit 5 n=1 Tax=Peronospora matthiolae TaxID=2874970 RepID=A0AAV1UJ52_9STRA